jgi:hypothetical protein
VRTGGKGTVSLVVEQTPSYVSHPGLKLCDKLPHVLCVHDIEVLTFLLCC